MCEHRGGRCHVLILLTAFHLPQHGYSRVVCCFGCSSSSVRSHRLPGLPRPEREELGQVSERPLHSFCALLLALPGDCSRMPPSAVAAIRRGPGTTARLRRCLRMSLAMGRLRTTAALCSSRPPTRAPGHAHALLPSSLLSNAQCVPALWSLGLAAAPRWLRIVGLAGPFLGRSSLAPFIACPAVAAIHRHQRLLSPGVLH